ncbi:MAG: rhomboid family intramembrane serine protease [Candidatus Heimdallarchaeota archaeon]|nr:rhomboid family intramembrane serine protease [Candidatus Heimdallarchaeota archaeon]
MTEETETYSFDSFWKSNLPTRNILIIILVVHITLWIITLVQASVITFDVFYYISEDLLKQVGQYNQLVYQGHVYQLFSSIFVHFDWLHILSNCLFLLIFGLKAEDYLLSWQYYAVFIISGLMGGLLSLTFGAATISAGASGGVFGLLGADITIVYQEEKDKKPWIYVGIGVIFLAITAGVNTNVLAHAIGLVTGFLFPVIFKKRRNLEAK